MCDNERLEFIKEQKASKTLNSLGLKIRSSEIPLSGNILFQIYQMNEVVNKFL